MYEVDNHRGGRGEGSDDLFLVWFNNLDWTVGFYWSYMLLLLPPVLMRS